MIIRVYHKVRPKGYQSAQLGSRNHCKLNSALLLQTKVMAGTLEREQQDKKLLVLQVVAADHCYLLILSDHPSPVVFLARVLVTSGSMKLYLRVFLSFPHQCNFCHFHSPKQMKCIYDGLYFTAEQIDIIGVTTFILFCDD